MSGKRRCGSAAEAQQRLPSVTLGRAAEGCQSGQEKCFLERLQQIKAVGHSSGTCTLFVALHKVELLPFFGEERKVDTHTHILTLDTCQLVVVGEPQ